TNPALRLMVLPLLIVVFAGVYYVYSEVKRFMSESMVRNKVVVITDAVSRMGMRRHLGSTVILCWCLSFMWHLVSYCLYFLFQTFTPKLVLCVDVLICNSSMKIKAPVHINYFRPITLAKGRQIKEHADGLLAERMLKRFFFLLQASCC
uniref:Dehydrogenase/reductase (SDR family) member 7Cb n=1 Tax=Cyprinus carpio TaxID=7962 RepID=A0A8C1VU66_CYPCA